jgi:hypothetical protein
MVNAMKILLTVTGLVMLCACSRGASQQTAAIGGEEIVDGAGKVSIGMTESEVSGALGAEPIEHKGIDVAWRLDQRPHPGAAVGSFPDGHLSGIHFTARLDPPIAPRITKATADTLTKYDVVVKAIAGKLTLAEVEAMAGKPGRLAMWTLTIGQGLSRRTIDAWFWEIDPGGKVLIVTEEGGKASQPYVREMKH